jgi:hypothetical protein
MSMSIFKTALLTATACVFFSFVEDGKINISISSPTVKSTYKTRDTVWIKASVTSSEALHDVSIKVISLLDSSIVFSKHVHSHSTNMNIKEFYINPVLDKSDMKLVISTTGHDGKEAAKSEVKFKCLAKK